jgi:hypothetical protein
VKTELGSPLTRKGILLYILAYVLWLVNIVVCVGVVIQFRATVNALWAALGGDRYTLSLVNQVCLLLSGFVAFVYVMFLESHYRESVTPRKRKPETSEDVSARASTSPSRFARWLTDWGLGILLRRFAITTAIPLGMCLASLVALEIALRGIH